MPCGETRCDGVCCYPKIPSFVQNSIQIPYVLSTEEKCCVCTRTRLRGSIVAHLKKKDALK